VSAQICKITKQIRVPVCSFGGCLTYGDRGRNNSAVNSNEGELSVETILSHFGEENKPFGAVVPPIFQNSLFLHDTTEELFAAMSGNWQGPPYFYSKIANPTVDVVERKLAALEGTDRAKVIGGGIGAISTALSSELEAGAHAIVVESAYGPTRSYLTYLQKFGVSHTCVEGSVTEEVLDAIRPETKVIYLESPSSMVFRLQDVPAITKVAREKGITTMFDNTYNTPLYMKPADFGVDIVCHSASKYLGGHSDINAGVICTDQKRMDRILRNEINYYSNILHPFSSWLLLRGLRTLKLRVAHHELCANYVAEWLSHRPQVVCTHHVSLATYPQRALFQKLMSGSTGLFSFEPKNQDRKSIFTFCDALKLFGRGISWGGFESLVVPALVPATSTREAHWVIRLFCGLEDPEELRLDVENALCEIS
jgi:cystathionine beta-lyase/cystathionine gamma-synthase